MRQLTVHSILRSSLTLVVLCLVASTLGGCAYFNTFYHAKKFYGDAQKAEMDEMTRGASQGQSRSNALYKQSAEKCEKVLIKHPGSKWEDDARLLLAKAYFGRRDYLSARRELDQFLVAYPESNLRDDAEFWRGRTAFALEDYEDAIAVWGALLESSPDFDEREEIEYYMADAVWKSEQSENAVEAYVEFLKVFPKSDRSWDARLRLGEVYTERRNYTEAEKLFAETSMRCPDQRTREQALMLLGDCFERQGRLEEALELYVNLELTLDPQAFAGRVSAEEREEMRAAELAALAVAREDSLANMRYAPRDSLGNPILDPERNPGLVGGNEDFIDERADEALGTQNQGFDPNDPNSLAGGGLTQQQLTQQQLNQQQQQQQNTQDPNQRPVRRRDPTQRDEQDLAKAMIREGAVLAKLSRPWEAIMAYEQVIAEFDRSIYAAEAQYQIAYTYEVYLEDFEASGKAYEDVAQHGRTSFSDAATSRARTLRDTMTRLRAAAADTLGESTKQAAEAQFMKAELYLFQQERPEKALDEYRLIEKEFAGTDYAAKAALAQAYVQVNALADTARGRAKYAEVMRTYEFSEYGRQARRVLRGPDREPVDTDYAGPTVDELRAPENLAIFARADSLRQIEIRYAEAVADSIAEAQQLAQNSVPVNAGAVGSGIVAENPVDPGVAQRQAAMLEMRRQSQARADSMAQAYQETHAEQVATLQEQNAQAKLPGEFATVAAAQVATQPPTAPAQPTATSLGGVEPVETPVPDLAPGSQPAASGAVATGVVATDAVVLDAMPAQTAETPQAIPRGRSGKELNPYQVPPDGWTPVMGEERRRPQGRQARPPRAPNREAPPAQTPAPEAAKPAEVKPAEPEAKSQPQAKEPEKPKESEKPKEEPKPKESEKPKEEPEKEKPDPNASSRNEGGSR